MPEGMRNTGTGMHHAASRFALRAQEGDLNAALLALGEVTRACVACHAGYRIR
jgi:cytochrome c556